MADEPQRPTSNDDRTRWEAYWAAQGMPWRTQPEIDEERQRYLVERQSIPADHLSETFPYSNVNLTRADVEWLLSRHESLGMTGPVDWSDQRQHERDGVNLQGANLRGTDLAGLPLARADMGWAHIEQAVFEDAHLEHAALYRP